MAVVRVRIDPCGRIILIISFSQLFYDLSSNREKSSFERTNSFYGVKDQTFPFLTRLHDELSFETGINRLRKGGGGLDYRTKRGIEENSCRTTRLLSLSPGFHAYATVNNVKHRGSPFYFVHTFFLLPDKDDFLASWN